MVLTTKHWFPPDEPAGDVARRRPIEGLSGMVVRFATRKQPPKTSDPRAGLFGGMRSQFGRNCDNNSVRDSPMQLLGAIKRRFKNNGFRSQKIYLSPPPWIGTSSSDHLATTSVRMRRI